MSYGNYNGFEDPSYNAANISRMNGTPYAEYNVSFIFLLYSFSALNCLIYQLPGPSRPSNYDRYVPAQDEARYRNSYGDSYRPDGDSYRPSSGDSYRPDNWRHRAPLAGDHYEPSSESTNWRPPNAWQPGYQQPYVDRKSISNHWDSDRRDSAPERMFEPSVSWVSSQQYVLCLSVIILIS
jgi:hypothetical protein